MVQFVRPNPEFGGNLLHGIVRIHGVFCFIDEFAGRQLSAFDNSVDFAKSALEVAIGNEWWSSMTSSPRSSHRKRLAVGDFCHEAPATTA